MSENLLKLKIKEFRAIKEADIELNGITVISGINASGKSTISKLLYYLVKSLNEYDKLVLNNLSQELHRYMRLLDDFEREIFIRKREGKVSNLKELRKKRYFRDRDFINSLLQENELLEYVDLLFNELKSTYKEYKSEIAIRDIKRLQEVLKQNDNSNNLDTIAHQFKTDITASFKKARENLENRPKKIISQRIQNIFSDSNVDNKYALFEYDNPIISSENRSIPILHFARKVAYIDTPMSIGLETFSGHTDYWDDLNAILKTKYNSNVNDTDLYQIIYKDILSGEAGSVDEYDIMFSDDDFVFKRDDGKSFDLLDCATGVKSFSILQILLKRGFISDETLLIIDEPEAHLHPQWIVEYGRLIVLLNKKLGTKFLISTHNPDLVSAIKYISEKELSKGKLTYYLAEPSKDDLYMFKYSNLGVNISKIFNSFNISLDRINQYGVSDDDDEED